VDQSHKERRARYNTAALDHSLAELELKLKRKHTLTVRAKAPGVFIILCPFVPFCDYLRFVGDFQFLHGHAVTPNAHEALLRCVAERVFTVLPVERRIA